MNEILTKEYLKDKVKFHSSNNQKNKNNFIPNINLQSNSDFPYLNTIIESSLFSSATCQVSSLPYLLLIFIKAGKGKFIIDSNEYETTKNTLVILPPEHDFSFQTLTTPFNFDTYCFEGSMLNYLLSRIMSDNEDKMYIKKDCSKYLQLTISNFRYIMEDAKPDSDIMIFKCFLDIISDILFSVQIDINCENAPNHITKLKYLLDHEYSNPHTLDSLEDRIGIDKYRLCHDFSEIMHISPIQYLNQVRIEHSKQLLEETELTIHEIGEKVGIDNTTHFINLFKKQNGMTPLQYRNLRTRAFIQT